MLPRTITVTANKEPFLKINLPETSKDVISVMLRVLSNQLATKFPDADKGAGFLGGRNGYGVNFENEVFMMHSYCWCEKKSCLWCSGCKCSWGKVEHYFDGKLVDDWIERCQAITAPLAHEVAKYGTPEYEEASKVFYASCAERDKRHVIIYPETRHSCKPKGLMEDMERGTVYSRQAAPNFWYKPTNFKVWWYKYIGRDAEQNRLVTAKEWIEAMEEMLISINSPCLEDATKKYDQDECEEHEDFKKAMNFLSANDDLFEVQNTPMYEKKTKCQENQ